MSQVDDASAVVPQLGEQQDAPGAQPATDAQQVAPSPTPMSTEHHPPEARFQRLESHFFETACEGLEAVDMLARTPILEEGEEEEEEEESATDGADSYTNLKSWVSALTPRGLIEFVSTAEEDLKEETMNTNEGDTNTVTDFVIEEDIEKTVDADSQISDATVKVMGSQTSDPAGLEESDAMEGMGSQRLDAVAEGMDAADASEVRGVLVPNEENPAQPVVDGKELIVPVLPPGVSMTEVRQTVEIPLHETAPRDTRTDSDDSTVEDDRWPLQWPKLLDRFHQFNRHIDRTGELISRDRAFYQTSNQLNIRCMIDEHDRETKIGYYKILLSDYVDVLINQGTSYVIVFLVVIYTVALLIFAGIYYGVSHGCSPSERLSFSQAFALSLETASTVGYTLPQSNEKMFFNGCQAWVIFIFIQCIFSLIFNGIVIGILTLRYSRADRRSNQIIFSNYACILCIRGRFYFTFQCFDLHAKQPIIGATVKIFAIVHEVSKEARALWQVRAMRLSRPDDELGSKLWLSVPCVCIHEIDAWSPLAPSLISKPPHVVQSTAPNRFPQPPQRSADGRAGSRMQTICGVCGLSFLTEAALRRHIQYSQIDERARERDESTGHLRLNPRSFSRPVVLRHHTSVEDNASVAERTERAEKAEQMRQSLPYPVVEPESVRDAIKQRIEERNIEVVCILEGTDPHTGRNFQARHSYKKNHIRYDAQHAPCMGVGADGGAEVNLSYFHDVRQYDASNVNIEEPFAFPSHV